MFWNGPSAGLGRIERRAQRIGDPIARLRYLRQAMRTADNRRPVWHWLAPAVLALAAVSLASDTNVRARVSSPPAPTRRTVSQPDVWLVEQTSQFEIYSNGLRIERRFEVANEPRWYALTERGSDAATGPLRSQPMGIVFHVTESEQAPFEAEQNHKLNRIGRELLLYTRNKRAYHFVIDRFGRVFRVVVESDTANHAGNSVWADARFTYLSLNASFLGVAFEARTHSDEPPMNPAQLHAAKILVDMLLDKYHFSRQNCVTHAQVSVNPTNMRIGWHTDWGTGFPFQALGLPDNYEYPNPALSMFGFEYDGSYRTATGPDLWRGISSAEEQLRESAAEHGMPVTAYRTSLQKQYRQAMSALRERSGTEEN
jgi:hypothetical protein